ncbi:MAG: carboxypeptidase-like regulatory domain-containing protein [Planctomycetota bacterium]
MKIGIAQRLAAALACVGMIAQPSLATAPVASPAVADVALADGGVFVGKVVNGQGAVMADTTVSLQQAGQQIATAKTNEEGVFAVQGLRGGLYQVVADNGVVSYRLWAPNTAPPAANQSALIVTGDAVVSGQQYGQQGGGVLRWMRENPLLVGAGVAAAIAIPIAVDDDDDPAS